MDASLKKYIRIALFNLSLVALIGVVLRYKIVYSLPFVDQKHLLHGHSHFAFAGWVTQALMVLMVSYLSQQIGADMFRSYRWLLIANLVAAYGMLLTFPLQGYGPYSISFSTLSVLVSYFFAIKYWKDLNRAKVRSLSAWWFKAALAFGVLSSAGTFALAFMMANKMLHQNWYLASVYFYLHFQYNGWFFFVCMGLLFAFLPKSVVAKQNELKWVYYLFTAACVPAYILSALWLPLPGWIYAIVVLSAMLQLIAWALLLKILIRFRNDIFETMPLPGKWALWVSALALTIKLCLQAASTIPALGQWAFGFRSIVIAYLHLVLLGIISTFMIGYMFVRGYLSTRRLTVAGFFIFLSGVYLNELVLMIQGIASITYDVVPFGNELLLLMAVIIFSGVLIMVSSQLQHKKEAP